MRNKIYHSYILLLSALVTSTSYAQFIYTSPVPGASFENPETGIILRSKTPLNESFLSSPTIFHVTGSVSGEHALEIKLVQDDRTVILQPQKKFTEGETISVSVSDGITNAYGETIEGKNFTFKVHDQRTPEQRAQIARAMQHVYEEDFPSGNENKPEPPQGVKGIPDFTILTNTTTSTGDVFFSDFNYFVNNEAHYCIVNNNGDSVFGREDTVLFNNFDLNSNGYMTVYNAHDSDFLGLDSNYRTVAIYKMGNGYKPDVHEFRIFPDGTHWMLCYDPQIIDMRVYDPSYDSAATVVGCVLQELDWHNNVLFQWRSWDHFGIMDADHINFAASEIDDVHSNAIDIDNDGNILLTSRHLSEITKINSETGDIIWRFGGGTQNQFTFTNDADKVSWCHDGRRIANGHITVFDNGNYHTPSKSWAKEYQLDEVNKTATLVWSFKRTTSQGDIYTKAMGDVQRLSNGNTLICWGLVLTLNDVPKITEVDSLNNIVWELQLANQNAVYRAHRYDWVPCSRPSSATISASNITSTSAKLKWKSATNASSYDVQYRKVGTTTWNTKNFNTLSAKLKNLTPDTKYEYQIRSHCISAGSSLSDWTSIKKFKTLLQRLDSVNQNDLNGDLYPNPTAGNLFLTVDGDQSQEISVDVYDATGKLLIHESKEYDGGNQEMQINTSSLPAGFYFAEINSAAGRTVKKFIKQ